MKLVFSNLAFACSLAFHKVLYVEASTPTLKACSCKENIACRGRKQFRRELDVLYDRVEISATGESFVEEVEHLQRRAKSSKSKGEPEIDPAEPCSCSACSLVESTEGACCSKSTKASKGGSKGGNGRNLSGKRRLGKHDGHAAPGNKEEEEGNHEARQKKLLTVTSESSPWIQPNAPAFEVELLSSEPGVWKIHKFLSDDQLDKVVDAVNRGGNGNDLYRRCNAASQRHLDNKFCFFLSKESAVEHEDSELVASLLDQMSDVWPTKNVKCDHFDVMLTRGGCTHSLFHFDLDDFSGNTTALNYATITSIIYLSDGGAGTYFPDADLLVEPEKGAVLTWLNVNSDNSPKMTARHGVQASADNDPDRLVLGYRTTFAKDEFPMFAKEDEFPMYA